MVHKVYKKMVVPLFKELLFGREKLSMGESHEGACKTMGSMTPRAIVL